MDYLIPLLLDAVIHKVPNQMKEVVDGDDTVVGKNRMKDLTTHPFVSVPQFHAREHSKCREDVLS